IFKSLMHRMMEDKQETSTVYIRSFPKVCGVELKENEMFSYLRELENFKNRNLRPSCMQKILNSKACRSAIMFGDYLSISQCNELIDSLSQCKLPFQCAHGRPSMVPLFEI